MLTRLARTPCLPIISPSTFIHPLNKFRDHEGLGSSTHLGFIIIITILLALLFYSPTLMQKPARTGSEFVLHAQRVDTEGVWASHSPV